MSAAGGVPLDPEREQKAKRFVGGEIGLTERAGATVLSYGGRIAKETADGKHCLRLSQVETVPVRSLLSADTPRSAGEDPQHIRLLSSLEETALPAVIVHRPTMRIVDGMHRLRVAMLRGDKDIRVRFFDGDERDAFVIAVRENLAHGLPLSADDRAAAAERIVCSHPHWSDKVIGEVTGLPSRTVGTIRRSVFVGSAQPVSRPRNDRRIRGLGSSAGRIRAAELMAKEPHASLRRIAKQAGISPSTVRDVRKRLERGESPLPSSSRSADAWPATASRGQPAASTVPAPAPAPAPTLAPAPVSAAASGARADRSPGPGRDRRRTSPLQILIRDPALRSREHNRVLLRMLSMSVALAPSREQLIDAVPEHCVDLVCRAAKESAAAWAQFARDLERRATRTEG